MRGQEKRRRESDTNTGKRSRATTRSWDWNVANETAREAGTSSSFSERTRSFARFARRPTREFLICTNCDDREENIYIYRETRKQTQEKQEQKRVARNRRRLGGDERTNSRRAHLSLSTEESAQIVWFRCLATEVEGETMIAWHRMIENATDRLRCFNNFLGPAATCMLVN